MMSQRLPVALVVCVLACTPRPADDDLREHLALLQSGNAELQRRALAAVTEMGPRAEAALSIVAGLVESQTAAVRAEACIALVALDASGGKSVAALRGRLRDSDPDVREAAAIGLGLLGTRAEPAYRELDRIGRDAPLNVRAAALYARAKIRGSAADLTPLAELFASGDPRGRFLAARGFRELGPVAASIVPMGLLLDSARDADPGIATEALRIIAQRGPAADCATSLLDIFRSGKNPGAALAAILAVDPTGSHAISAFADCLVTCPNAEARGLATTGLARYGAKAGEAVPFLLRSLRDTDGRVVVSALDALAELSPPYEVVGPALLSLVGDGSGAASWRAVQLLTHYRDVAEEDLTALLERSSNPDVRLKAAYALTRTGAGSVRAQHSLRRAAHDPSPDVRNQALLALKAL